MIAMFFVIFDVEAAYLYAWAVAVPVAPPPVLTHGLDKPSSEEARAKAKAQLEPVVRFYGLL